MTREVFLSDKSLSVRYGVSRASIWRWVQAGRLPKPLKLSPGCTRWRSSDIEQWEAKRGEVAQ